MLKPALDGQTVKCFFKDVVKVKAAAGYTYMEYSLQALSTMDCNKQFLTKTLI